LTLLAQSLLISQLSPLITPNRKKRIYRAQAYFDVALEIETPCP
jgi:hypothetical protein